MATKPTQFSDWPASIDPGFGPYRAVIQSVTDGDTLRVLIDAGFNGYSFQSIRLLGVNSPELFTSDTLERERGRAASSHLESVAPPGTKCLLRTDRDKTTFGRYVASILLADGRDLASEMVASGHAVWADY